jgi:hypothetical protein
VLAARDKERDMPYSIVLHIANAEPILAEVDDLPGPGDVLLKITHPRRIDGKDLTFLMDKVVTVLWPLEKINFIEILPGEEEDDIIGFVRE